MIVGVRVPPLAPKPHNNPDLSAPLPQLVIGQKKTPKGMPMGVKDLISEETMR